MQMIGIFVFLIIWINSCIPPLSSLPAIPSTSSIIRTCADPDFETPLFWKEQTNHQKPVRCVLAQIIKRIADYSQNLI